MKALLVCSWSRFGLGCRDWLGVRNLSLALLLLPRRTFLLESRLILDSHHMAVTYAFLDVTLYRLEHAAQLIQALLSPVHVVIRDEVYIARRQRGKNEVSGQLLAKEEAQLLQPLCVTNHLDYMQPYWCFFC